MDGAALSSLRWMARREASRLSWRGIAGVALIVVAAAIVLTTLLPAQHRAQSVRAEVAELRTRLKSSGESPNVAPPRATQLENYYAFFPTVESLPDWVGRVHTAAARNDLALESGDYLLERRKDARLAQYQITLPVHGSYAQIRGFVAEVLEKVPAAALEDVVVKRENIGVPTLEARVRFVLYLNGEAAP